MTSDLKLFLKKNPVLVSKALYNQNDIFGLILYNIFLEKVLLLGGGIPKTEILDLNKKTICLFSISLLYGISNLVSLEATHFFCPVYNEEQVRQHNFENGNEYGESVLSCWYIERSKIDLQAVRSLDIDIFKANFDNLTA